MLWFFVNILSRKPNESKDSMTKLTASDYIQFRNFKHILPDFMSLDLRELTKIRKPGSAFGTVYVVMAKSDF